jgi:asparagine synthase (glutamine-hydrolysing)
MCGIAGYLDSSSKTESSVLEKMIDSIFYRGPDSSGRFNSNDRRVGLGIRRLRIIDLTRGDQPIRNEDGTIAVVYNGEIYNYKKLRKDLQKLGHKFTTESDTEVLVHGYEAWGDDFVKKLNGMFSFALWDDEKKRLFLGRDRVGIKPLYYYLKNNLFVFGSEPKAILEHPGYHASVDQSALNIYWYLGFFAGERSVFKGIKKLLPGHTLSVKKGKLKIKKYFDLGDLTLPRSGDLDLLIDRAVKGQLVADVPVGVFLSGGLDSSLIAYYISKYKKLKSFSIGFEEPGYDETEAAEYVAKMLGTKHISGKFTAKDVVPIFEKVVKKIDEPLADASLIPTFKVSELAREHVAVALSGDGGDELFGGYPTHQAHLFAGIFKFLPHKNLLALVDALPENVINLLPTSFKDYSKKELAKILLEGMSFDRDQIRHFYWMRSFFLGDSRLGKSPTGKRLERLANIPEGISVSRIGQIVDFQTYLRDDFLVKTDRASMFNSLEVRVPFLDNDVLAYAFTTDRAHLDFVRTKILLRRLLADALPKIAKKPKKGFGLPLKIWLKGELADFAKSYLANGKLYNYLDKKKIEKIWSDFEAGKNGNAGVIWQTISFSGWLENWL